MGTPTGAATANSEGKCLIIVYNYCLYPSPPSKFDLTLDLTDTYSSLHSQVAQKTAYPSEAFELYFGSKKFPFQDSDAEKTLSELSFPSGKCMLQLRRKQGSKDSDFGSDVSKKVTTTTTTLKSTPTLHLGNAATTSSYSHALVPIGPVTEAGAAAGYNRNSYSSMDWNKKSKTGFVGLSNQGATCYMNSLIQTLYMTPEFRSALYKWSFEETWKKREKERREKEGKMEVENDPTEQERKKEYERDSIPRQLQLLFARLQLRDIRAVKTKHLTNSFGWKESDAFTQHDVQELCRVLFDALEKVFKGTEQETLINDLYQGEMKDYVRCKVCDHESLRTDKYLDIPLVIRGFGSTTAIKSVEEALAKFVQPELLYGDNQYKCGKCNINVDATKGLKFTSFPYLLTLQLKRFDFDYNTFRRIKLNDLVTFPYILDMNEFLEDADTKPTKRKLEDQVTEPMELDLNENDSKSEEGELNNNNNNNNNSSKGPYLYELYSVLIHRGSALGGHYYAYIKSFEQNKWFEFNDSTVTEINEEDIKKSFGDEDRPKGYAQYYHSSANAYMLMYRRIDSAKNVVAVTNEDVPQELKDYIQAENDKRKRKQEEQEKEREMVKLKVFYQGIEKEVKLHQTTTLAEATTKCAEAFDIRNDPSCIRLRNYQTYNSLPQEPLDGEDILSKTLDNLNFYSGKSLMVETRDPSEPFPEYNPQDMMLRVIVYDRDNDKFLEPKQVFVDKDARLGELKKILAQKFRIPENKQRLLREAVGYGMPSAKVLVGDSELLRLEHRVFEAAKIYLEHCDDPESESPAAAEIERTKNMIEIKFNMPGKDEATQSVTVNRKMPFGDFKKLISPIIHLSPDEFRVSRGTIHWKIELKSEKETLDEHRLSDGSKVIIEKGKPLKDGESVFKFHLFDPFNKRNKETFEEVFESSVSEDVIISDLKVKLCQQLKTEKNIDIEPTKLRLREMYTRNPSKIYKDKNTLKDSCNVIYSGKSIAMQELEHEEDVKKDSDIAIFIQQWFPSKYELGQKYEITVDEHQPVSFLKSLLSEKYGIKNIGFAKVMGSWPGPDILDIPDMYWNKEVPEWQGEGKAGSIGHAPYYLRDGDILLVKDNDEIEKELTKEEKQKMEKEANMKKRPTYYAKEEALHINAKV